MAVFKKYVIVLQNSNNIFVTKKMFVTLNVKAKYLNILILEMELKKKLVMSNVTRKKKKNA